VSEHGSWRSDSAPATIDRRRGERLAEPFKGVTAKGDIEPSLFTVRATGVSTEPVHTGASAFLASLTAEQRKGSTFASDARVFPAGPSRVFRPRTAKSSRVVVSVVVSVGTFDGRKADCHRRSDLLAVRDGKIASQIVIADTVGVQRQLTAK
jgi:hypothetical protein